MLYSDFAAALAQAIDPVYWLKGEDDYALEQALGALKGLCDEMDLSVFGGTDSVNDALAGANCFPFMGGRRVVILRDIALGEEDKKHLTAYCAAPCETTVLVLYRCAWAPKGATVCDFEKPKPIQVEQWLSTYCAEAETPISRAAAHLLVDYCDADTARIVAELVKLRALADGAAIDEAMVRSLVLPSDNYRVYAFSDLVSKGDYVGAFRMVDSFVGQGSDRDYPMFLGLLTTHYRMAYYRKITDLSDDELGRLLGGKKGFAVKKAGETARRYTPAALYRLLQHLYRVEFAFKTGQMTSRQALESAVVQAVERRSN